MPAGAWTKYLLVRKECVRTTWAFRLAIVVVLIASTVITSRLWTRWLGESLVCQKEVRPADAILLDNLEMDYYLFPEARTLKRSGVSARVLVPTIAFLDLNGPSMSKDFVEVMARIARLGDVETIPVWEVEPISLNVAEQVGDFIKANHIESVMLVTPGFRSLRSYWTYDRVFKRQGVSLSCVPVFGPRTPANWSHTWHGVQEILLQFVKLQYYRLWILPRAGRRTPGIPTAAEAAGPLQTRHAAPQ
jgi:hypothetical protein